MSNLQIGLSRFNNGTENYYQHWTRRLFYTDGVRYLAEEAHAYWLIDAIASYQGDRRIVNNPMLRQIQFWVLRTKDNKGTLICRADSGMAPAITQDIEFTDFPLDEVQLWVELGSIDGVGPAYVAMLPSER